MTPRRKTGGRKRGVPNRRTLELTEQLAELDFDPVAALVKIAKDPATSTELQIRCITEIMPYCFPRRKAVEHTGLGDVNVVNMSINAKAALEARIEGIRARMGLDRAFTLADADKLIAEADAEDTS